MHPGRVRQDITRFFQAGRTAFFRSTRKASGIIPGRTFSTEKLLLSEVSHDAAISGLTREQSGIQ
jgi:hypothetical protein